MIQFDSAQVITRVEELETRAVLPDPRSQNFRVPSTFAVVGSFQSTPLPAGAIPPEANSSLIWQLTDPGRFLERRSLRWHIKSAKSPEVPTVFI